MKRAELSGPVLRPIVAITIQNIIREKLCIRSLTVWFRERDGKFVTGKLTRSKRAEAEPCPTLAILATAEFHRTG